ncbi:Oxysterol receptor LXR-beta, partial [Taenia solium]
SPYSTAATPTATGCSGLLRPRQCRYRDFQSLCYHSTCRRALLRQHRRLLNSSSSAVVAAEAGGLELERPDERLFTCLTECVQRIREPFSPEEPLDTQAAETLEQEYNRMDTCIRRIIRVVKMLPYFNEIGKPAQLGLLRANIYGMIVLYSSFFFEREIRKLRYPVKQADGSLTTVTVSMLDDLAPSAANTLAAFNHLEELTGEDDILRMTLLAIKLFSDDSLSDELQSVVVSSKRVYLVFLWTYIRWRAGPKHLRQATELFARLHLAFIDLRSLEIRMTEFAKLVSLEGLSPLMREICSLRSNRGPSTLTGVHASHTFPTPVYSGSRL